MADVRSKNLYELLGNDPEQDSDREPEPPTKTIDKTAPRHGKRDAPKESLAAPIAPRGGGVRGDRRGGRVNAGNEEAFHDRNAGSYNNRNRPTDEQKEAGRRGIRARDDRGARTRQDRHPVRTGHTDTEKQVGQGWGANKGDAEWSDEKAGEAIARTEENAPQTPLEGGELAAAEEEADKSKSYAEYLAEQAAGKREELGVKAARAPNEGVKDKKWEAAKEIKRDDEEEAYIKGKEEKARRERQRKEKNLVDVDMRFVEPTRGRGGTGPREGGRGGRGARGARGGRGSFEGGSRGGARGGSEGGRGGPRGGFEGGRGGPRGGFEGVRGGPRGGYEGSSRGGGRGGPTGPTVDEKNFPSLGGK